MVFTFGCLPFCHMCRQATPGCRLGDAMKILQRVLATVLCAGLSVGPLFAQSSSGTITGRVLDESGQPVPGANVTLTRTDIQDVRTLVSPNNGVVVFTNLQPGPYTLEVELSGFAKLQKTNLILNASDRVSVGDLTLKVGGVSETIVVESERAPIQTESSEHGAVIDAKQITELPTRGRDVYGLMATLPGVVYDGRGADGIGSAGSPAAFSGTRGIYSTANIDGISGNVRSGSNLDTTIAMDTVAEVKVLLNNYQAEYGKGAAGVINLISKSGSQNFSGSGYYYLRHEALNANDYFRNASNTEKGRYRYNTMGATLGGPVAIPGLLDRHSNKLFFFGAYEYRPSTTPNDTRYYSVPTAAERNGDFNRSVGDAKGNLYAASKIIDPLTGKPFPNGIIPANRIDPNMQKLLNIFPLPNAPDVINGGALNPSGQWYNFSITDSQKKPGNQYSVKVDYNLSDTIHAFVRTTNYGTHNKGTTSAVNRFPWMADADIDYALGGHNHGGTVTWIASPTIVNELIVGYARWTEQQLYRDDWLAKLQKDKLGINLPQQFPAQNKLDVIPALNFGSTNIGPNSPTVRWEGRFPLKDIADSWTLTDNLTKVWRSHQFKTGVAFELVHYLFVQGGPSDVWSGRFDFASNTANPLNTTYPYANALLGYFNTYQESTNRTQYSPITPILEFYVQDSWKASQRLTLDLGVRFTVGLNQYQGSASQTINGGYQSSAFVPSRYNPANAPLLYQPALNGSTRVAVDPRNPTKFLPEALVGQIVPGTGDPLNGIVVSGEPGYPRSLVDYQGILPAPRLGFAWDLFGNGAAAMRGGFGVIYNPRNGGGVTGDLQSNPPNVYTATTNYGTTQTYLDAQGTISPPGFSRTLNRSNPPNKVYNATLGLQTRLPGKMVLDVAYVGTFGKNIGTTTQLNNLPYGTRFLPSSMDPTRPVPQALPDNFLRPYQGYAGIPFVSFDASSNYHAVQTSLQRRFHGGFQLGVVYSYSKAMDYSDDDKGDVVTFTDRRVWNYGLAAYDRTHIFSTNYVVDLPGSHLKNALMRGVLGGWQISGLTRFQSGTPLSLDATLKAGCNADASLPCVKTSANNFGTDILGGGGGDADRWRAVISGDPTGGRGGMQWFNPNVVSPPALAQTVTDMAGVQRVLAAGNAGRRFGRGPGMMNTDLALFKRVPLGGSVNAQIRAEAYNVFNHTQFDTVNVAPSWDQSGVQTNPAFGKLTGARDPRIIQLALRLVF
jgi:hypothetical protein